MLNGITKQARSALEKALLSCSAKDPVVTIATKSIVRDDTNNVGLGIYEQSKLDPSEIVIVDGIKFYFDPSTYVDINGKYLGVNNSGKFCLIDEMK